MSSQTYQMITDRVVTMLEAGTVPWRKGWTGGAELPMSAVSKKAYRGFNHFSLRAAGYVSPYWMSFKQAQEAGGKVRKGEICHIGGAWLCAKPRLRRIEDANSLRGKSYCILYVAN